MRHINPSSAERQPLVGAHSGLMLLETHLIVPNLRNSCKALNLNWQRSQAVRKMSGCALWAFLVMPPAQTTFHTICLPRFTKARRLYRNNTILPRMDLCNRKRLMTILRMRLKTFAQNCRLSD